MTEPTTEVTTDDEQTPSEALIEQQAQIADQLRAYAETANGHRLLLIGQGWDEHYATHYGAQVLGSLQQTFLEQLRLNTEHAGRQSRGVSERPQPLVWSME